MSSEIDLLSGLDDFIVEGDVQELLAHLVHTSTSEQLILWIGSRSERRLELLKVGVKCFNQFLQANWTGPSVSSPAFTVPSESDETVTNSLEVDGEAVYVGCLHKELLLAAIRIFKSLNQCSDLRTVGIWLARANFVWQRVLADSNDRGQGNCPTLMNVCLNQFCLALGESGYLPKEIMDSTMSHLIKTAESSAERSIKLPDQSLVSLEVRAELILEFVVRLSYYGKCNLIPNLMSYVTDMVGITVNVTGVEGIRRQYQTVAFAQLAARVAHTKASAAVAEPSVPAPKALTLMEMDVTTDILEDVKLADEVANQVELTSKLSSIEQCCLVAEALRFFYSGNSRDELNLESVHALAMRIISTSADAPPSWIAFSMCLLLRSRAEFFRNNTRGRACFQTDALVEQFKDPSPEPVIRLRHLHCTGYPSVWELQRENGMRMMEVGMVVTAFEMFKKLKMWPLAMDCLAVAGKKQEALELLDTLEPLSARLLVSKGDMTGEFKHYEEAWERSKHTSARAKRALGRLKLRDKDLGGAAECFELSLKINPLFDEIWFNLGSVYLKLDDLDKATFAFVQCVGVNPDHVQGWVNLSAVYSNEKYELDHIREAKNAAGEAVRLSPQAWQFWENYVLICARAQDWQNVIRGEQRLSFILNRAGHPDIDMIRLLVAKVKDSSVRVRLLNFLEDIVLKNKQTLESFKILALMYIEFGRYEESAKTRIVQLKEILSLIGTVGESSSKYSAQQIVDEIIACLGDIADILESPQLRGVPGVTTGLGLTVRSVPRRISVINGGQDLPNLKSLCERIEGIIKSVNSISE